MWPVHGFRIISGLLVNLELISLLAIEKSGLETEIRHITEHFSIFGEDNADIDGIDLHSLLLGRIEHHLAQRDAVLHTDHRIVIDGELAVNLHRIEILVRVFKFPFECQ